jgi:hypothetical protein
MTPDLSFFDLRRTTPSVNHGQSLRSVARTGRSDARSILSTIVSRSANLRRTDCFNVQRCTGGNLVKSKDQENELTSAQKDRRAFLESAGKFAIGVPPALVVLLSTSMSSSAIAQSTGGGGQETQEVQSVRRVSPRVRGRNIQSVRRAPRRPRRFP